MKSNEREQKEPSSVEMLRVKQVAALLGVSAPCVYAIVREGKLACHRIGVGRGAVRIRRSDLDAYLESCRVSKNEGQRVSPTPRGLKHIKLKRV